MYSKHVIAAQEHDRILDAFEDALNAAADQLADLRTPTRDLGKQIAKFSTLMNWLFDGGWIRWGWPEEVGGLGGSSILRCEILERLACAATRFPTTYKYLRSSDPRW